MKKLILSAIAGLTLVGITQTSFSQSSQNQKIKLFVDCSNAFCDNNYIKTQIDFIDYVLDNQAADIHLLITQQNNGGGGSQYQLIFYGQHRFHISDTLRYNTKPNNTDFENRNLLVKYIQIGLLPFISKTSQIESLSLQLKQEGNIDSSKTNTSTKDPWNYWVYRVGINGNINADAVYKSFRYNGNISAGRVTDKMKVSFNLSGGKNRDSYEFADSGGTNKIIVKNENYDFSHQLVKSITQHWSAGYDLGISRSTFTNYKSRIVFRPGIEYDLFPYKDVNNKLFTIKYGVDLTDNNYIDTTIYFKTKETLLGQDWMQHSITIKNGGQSTYHPVTTVISPT